MYECKLNKLKPTLEAFINNLKHIHEADKHAHLMEMTYEKFIKKWTPYNDTLTKIDLMQFVCTSVNLTCLPCVLFDTIYVHTHKKKILLFFTAMTTEYEL